MAQQRATIRPQGSEPVLSIKVRVTSTDAPEGAEVTITDLMLQAGGTVTGWTPHVAELPWTAGIVGGAAGG